jgi:hypothetical protein
MYALAQVLGSSYNGCASLSLINDTFGHLQNKHRREIECFQLAYSMHSPMSVELSIIILNARIIIVYETQCNRWKVRYRLH